VKPSLETWNFWSNREALVVQEGLGAPSLCSLEQKLSWKLSREEMDSWFTFFFHQMLNHVHVTFLLGTKNSRMCLRRKNAYTLPKHQPYNCTIDLVEGVQLPFEPIYNLSQDKLAMLRKYINENLEKGFIWHSKSLVGALILFVKKNDGSFQMCVDDHGFNLLTINNRYPLPLILGLFD
jgi:hypothetical protein